MAAITVLGGTGYTGTNVVRTAAARGHTMTSVSRSLRPSVPMSQAAANPAASPTRTAPTTPVAL